MFFQTANIDYQCKLLSPVPAVIAVYNIHLIDDPKKCGCQQESLRGAHLSAAAFKIHEHDLY